MKQLSIYDILDPKSYHQTTDITVREYIEKEKKTKRQEDIVIEIFKTHKMLSPSQLHKIWCKTQLPVPLTSLRRACSNLTRNGLLRKTATTIKGPFGDKEHVWSIIGIPETSAKE